MSTEIPTDLQYTRDHEWIRIEGDTATVGVTHHAQSALGDVVFVELLEVGAKLEASDPFGTIESVKAVSEAYMPVGGEVIEVNDTLIDDPELINTEPYGDGWLIKVRVAAGAAALMSADAYEKYVDEIKH